MKSGDKIHGLEKIRVLNIWFYKIKDQGLQYIVKDSVFPFLSGILNRYFRDILLKSLRFKWKTVIFY